MTPPRMHADEVPTDEALVRRLLAAQFPQWADLRVARVPSAGTDNALYRLGDQLVVRLPRIHWAVGDVAKEQRWLPALAPHLPVSIPEPVAMGGPGEGYPWPWAVVRWLEGDTPNVDALAGRPAHAASLADALAGFVVALQRIDPTGAPPASRGVPLAERDVETRAALGEVASWMDVDGAEAVWDDALAAPAWAGPAVWIHGDLLPGNLLCRDGRLAAVIDFGGMGVGDPAADMLAAWALFPRRARERFRLALGVDGDTWRRGRGWALSVALLQLPYYRHTNAPLAAGARQVLRAVLAEARRSG